MQNIELVAETEVARPAERVWGVVADYGQDPRWRAGVSTMDPSAPGIASPGLTTDERMRFAGRAYRNGGVVTAVEPGARLTWRTTSGVDADGERAVEAVAPDRARVRIVQRVRPTGVERLAAPLLRVVLQRRLTADVGRLRALLEA